MSTPRKKLLRGINDLATLYPELVKEWHPAKNDISPSDILPGSDKKIIWKCNVCDNEWEARVSSRVKNNRGCPYCSHQKPIVGKNDLLTVCPEICLEWDYEKNNGLKPESFLPQSHKKVWWKCECCGFEWLAPIYSRTGKNRNGCPNCTKHYHTSFPEQAIYYYVKSIDSTAENRKILQNNEIDIYIPNKKIGVEYDGLYFHKGSDSKNREDKKDNFFKEQGIRIIRVKDLADENKDLAFQDDVLYYSYSPDYKHINAAIIFLISEIWGINNFDVDVQRDRQKILASYLSERKRNSFAQQHPELLNEWHPTKNGSLQPTFFSSGSHETIWWKCSKCGYEWEMKVKDRVRGRGCLACAGKVINSNDLATLNPTLAKEWNYERNVDITPDKITLGSRRKVWWRCSKCNYEWEKTVAERNRGYGCPVCSNKKLVKGRNDLMTTNPDLAKEWHPTKNLLSPSEITAGSGKKAWWKCSKCGHEWEAVIASRNKGHGCHKCAVARRTTSNIKKTENES